MWFGLNRALADETLDPRLPDLWQLLVQFREPSHTIGLVKSVGPSPSPYDAVIPCTGSRAIVRRLVSNTTCLPHSHFRRRVMSVIQEPHGQSLVECIIRHERPLLPDDSYAIQASLSHLQNAKDAGETRIAALEAELRRLKSEQEAVCTSLQKHESVFSPIHRLPNEILLHIFQLCLPNFYKDSCLDCHDARFRLARTCRWWCDIVEGSPKLWTTLVMRLEDDYRDDASDSLSEFLRLSGEQPLKIVIIDNTHLLDIAATLKLLVPHSRRWQHLVLTNTTSAECLFEDLTPESIPMLEELYISRQWLAPPTSSEAIAAVSSAPSLKKAQLPFGLSFPPNLTHAHLRLSCNDGESAVKDFFMSHPLLTECHIFLSETQSPEIRTQSDCVEHANLETLVTDHTIFLDHLKLPVLTTLHLSETDVRIEPSSVDSVVRFLKRSHCQLTTLSVAQQSVYDSPEFITELLPLVSESVTTLHLNTEDSHPKILRDVMGALEHTLTAVGLFPRLTSLSVRTCMQNFDDLLEPFLEMVRSRLSSELATQWKAARLVDLGVDVRDVSACSEKRLLELADEGLSIWSVKQTRYGSRVSKHPPWLEYEPLTRKDLSKRRRSSDSYANESSCSDIEAMQYSDRYFSDSDSESINSFDSDSFSSASNVSWVPAPLAPPFLPSTQVLPHFDDFGPYEAPPPFIPLGPLSHSNADQHFHHWFPIGVPPSNNAPLTSSPQNVMHVYHHFSPSGDAAADAFSSPLQAPVIPESYDDDDDDDDYDGPEMTFPPVFNPDTMGPMFHSPSQFPYPFNTSLQNPAPSQLPYPFNLPMQESVPLSPSQFPYPFNMPMHHPFDINVPQSEPTRLVSPSPPSRRSSSRHARFSREVSCFGSPASSPRTDGGSILLQAEGSSSSRDSPEATYFDDDLSERLLSPLDMAGFEDVEDDDDYPKASGSGLGSIDSGYGGSPPFSSRQGSSSSSTNDE